VRLRWSGRQLFAVLLVSIAVSTGFGVADASAHGATLSLRSRAIAAFRHDRALDTLHRQSHGRHGAKAHASIVGGTLTSVEQVPWQVAILAEFTYESKLYTLLCGGSIVRDMSHVLTAGHCAYNPKSHERLEASAFTVIAGASAITEKEILEGPTVQGSGVAAVRVHPDFEPDAVAGDPDDIAELELESPLQPSPQVSMIGLPSPGASPAEGESVVLSGFGGENPLTAERDGNLYSLGETLGFSRECGGDANAVFLCGSTPAGSACDGDSGGGLLAGNPQRLVGIIDTVALVEKQECAAGADNGFANVTAPEILDFAEGSESPPLAPRGHGAEIRGYIEVGKSLSCKPGTWSGAPTYTYAFVNGADGDVLQRGALTSYALTSADLGRTILCEVFAANEGGTGVGRTSALEPIAEAKPASPPPSSTSGSGSATAMSSAGEVPPASGVLGSAAEGASRSQIEAALGKALVPSGKSAKIASISRSGSTKVKFDAPEPGNVSVDWYRVGAGGKQVLVASGHAVFSKKGTALLTIQLTKAGRRALRGRARIALTAKGTFKPVGAPAVTVGNRFVLTR
jgi:hypothetical protein